MTVNELIERLKAAKRKHGGDIDVMYLMDFAPRFELGISEVNVEVADESARVVGLDRTRVVLA